MDLLLLAPYQDHCKYCISSFLKYFRYNISAYLGGVIGGFPGALLCWGGLYLPGFFFMWSILPIWKLLKDKPFIKKILVSSLFNYIYEI